MIIAGFVFGFIGSGCIFAYTPWAERMTVPSLYVEDQK